MIPHFYLENEGHGRYSFCKMSTKTKKIKKKRTFIDLFAGIGGFRIALENSGCKCIFSSDWDSKSQLVYEENFMEKPYGDITKISERIIPAHNILCAGFPCQAFSVSGKQKGFKDIRGSLFFEIARIVKHHKPEVVFLENVKHFVKHDSGNTLKTILKTLNQLDYTCFYTVLNSSYYGVPQSRERFYLVGFRNDLQIKDFLFPMPNNKKIYLKDLLEKNGKPDKYIIKRDDIRIFDYAPRLKKDIFGDYPMKPIQIGVINKGGQGERIYSPEGHAITLSSQGGGAASKTGAYKTNGVIRKLTPKECLAIMGFPPNFKMPVTDRQAYTLIGNSVVVPVIESIAKEIIKKLENIRGC